MTAEPTLESVITCPHCGHSALELMPTDACQWFYTCSLCRANLRPKFGDCCVFCSYGSVPCPPIQLHKGAQGLCCPKTLHFNGAVPSQLKCNVVRSQLALSLMV